MLEVVVDTWKAQEILKRHPDLYRKLYDMSASSFISRPEKMELSEDGKVVSVSWLDIRFYVNELNALDSDLIPYCQFKPVQMLEMMGGANINSHNVFEAAKRNQIMLPNNLLLEMKELRVECDQCTDKINELMNDGWKLIAILPQHQQRRPDYILGR